jgi:hypothetical protein
MYGHCWTTVTLSSQYTRAHQYKPSRNREGEKDYIEEYGNNKLVDSTNSTHTQKYFRTEEGRPNPPNPIVTQSPTLKSNIQPNKIKSIKLRK